MAHVPTLRAGVSPFVWIIRVWTCGRIDYFLLARNPFWLDVLFELCCKAWRITRGAWCQFGMCLATDSSQPFKMHLLGFVSQDSRVL